MIDYAYADLFQKDNVQKNLILDFGDFQITNEKIYLESFELSETLCSEKELRFGSCESAVTKMKARNEFGNLENKWFNVIIVPNKLTEYPLQTGRYKVFSVKLSGDKKYINITAYDAMHDVINAEMVEWYDSLTFPITIRDFRYSFFAHLGIEQVEIELVNDDMIIEKTIDADSISGKQIITAICELNGVFGHINRQGLFDYVSLQRKVELLRPSKQIYPSQLIYPGMTVDLERNVFEYTPNLYKKCEYEDFDTKYITKLQIRQEETDIGSIVGNGNNTYIVEDNFLVYGKAPDELHKIAKRLYGKVFGVQYTPFKANVKGNPCIEVGDSVLIHTSNKTVDAYVLERKLKGIQSLQDTFEANGVYEYSEKVNSKQRDIKQLKGKTNKLERTVEMLNSEINDEENGLKSQIKQAAEEVTTKVSKGEVVSEINQSAEEVKIKGEKISLEGTVTANENFKVLEDGSIQSKNGTFEGTIKSKNAEITGGIVNIQTNSSTSNAISLYWNNYKNELAPYHIMFSDSSNESYFSSDSMWMSYLEELFLYVAKDGFNIYTNLSVGGTKSRLAKTKSYNDRLLYCYEMPSPMFGDIGHGVVGEDGLCYIDIDQIFYETIDTIQSYQVFLQSYSEHNVYVLERQPQYFVVKGEPNTEFDWEVKAKQLDFAIHRLEENFVKDEYKEPDYISLASEYLTQYEQEVLNYE